MSCQARPGIKPGPSALKASTLHIELTWQTQLPCHPGYSNSLGGGDCSHGGHYADDLAVN